MSQSYISPAKATKIYERVQNFCGFNKPTIVHYIRYSASLMPVNEGILKEAKKKNAHPRIMKFAEDFKQECRAEWTQILAKRYK